MKSALYLHCKRLAQQKVNSLEAELTSTQESTTSEGKSTAGDKHETGRAMMHLEQEKLHRQLAEAQALVAELERIDATVKHAKVGLGSLITTDKGMFFIATGLGKVEFEGTAYFVVSAKAPISMQLWGKALGDKVGMNGAVYEIWAVE
jgi:transcription elongation GreA/GreB family factor